MQTRDDGEWVEAARCARMERAPERETAMQRTPAPIRRQPIALRLRPGFTLVEIMITIGIIVILIAILLPAINAVRIRAKVNSARSQMQMIAMAIDEYARFWPASRGGEFANQATSSKGLPPWAYADVWRFNNPDLYYNYEFPNNTDAPPPPALPQDESRARELNVPLAQMLHVHADIYQANECLAWCLTAQVGTGPFLKQPPSGLVAFVPLGQANSLYPGSDKQRVRLYDPWGTPYFYCWVRDSGDWILSSPVSQRLPIGHVHVSELPGHTGFNFVLASAGPNRRFEFEPCEERRAYCTRCMQEGDFGDDIIFGR